MATERSLASPSLMINASRAQLFRAVETVANVDFPDKWPEVLPQISECLQSSDHNVVIAGLQTLYQIIKKYEYDGAAGAFGRGPPSGLT